MVVLLYAIIYSFFVILKKEKKLFSLRKFVIPTFIYLFLSFFPTVYYSSLESLTCRLIAGKEYLIADSQVTCNQETISGSRVGVSYSALAIPIFIFELMVLLFLFIILWVYKKRGLLNKPLEVSSSKYNLGYLYLGYKEDCFYWEFVRNMQRILIMSTLLVFFDYPD
jgi:hypothetical protein